LARAVCEKDDQVDELRKQVYTMVMQTVKNSPDTMDTLLRIDSVSKNIERIGDMATNVAEDVIYMVEGDIVRHRMTD
ncbi:MAG: phosphate transport system regulatory protein PhoU, partial [Pirellulales bacterium]|nr:phosphate transport system regulatory protein PhoU [Pirellulales bacterium]